MYYLLFRISSINCLYCVYSLFPLQFNLLGRLLGPKGMTVKRIQAETQTKMSILGRGSMRDKKKEEELRSTADPTYQHLKDELHVLIEANPPYSVVKLAAGVAEVKKMLIPLVKLFSQKFVLIPSPILGTRNGRYCCS